MLHHPLYYLWGYLLQLLAAATAFVALPMIAYKSEE
jgi:hypothetical protein